METKNTVTETKTDKAKEGTWEETPCQTWQGRKSGKNTQNNNGISACNLRQLSGQRSTPIWTNAAYPILSALS